MPAGSFEENRWVREMKHMKMVVGVAMGTLVVLVGTITVGAADQGTGHPRLAAEPPIEDGVGDVTHPTASANDSCRSNYEAEMQHANDHWQERMGQAQNLEDVGAATGHLGDETLTATSNFVSCIID
jgi:hypothetical protein